MSTSPHRNSRSPLSSRPNRRNINGPGHAHELTFSCYRGYKLLASDRSCRWLAESIDIARQQLEFDVWAWVFMPEHAHVVIRPRRVEYDIALIRRRIKEPVSRNAFRYLEQHAPEWIERLTRTRGARTERLFWQSGGGYDRNVTEPGTLLKMIDYVHNNPARRGLVERGCEWKWSSAAWFVNQEKIPLCVDPIPTEWAS